MKKYLSMFISLIVLILLTILFYPVKVYASNVVIYNNFPTPLPGNLPSQAFEAQSVSEFGGQIAFAGTMRTKPIVTVLLSSWGCESGHWISEDCLTTPGSTFSVPITLNIYEVNPDNSPGTKIHTVTNTFNIPYRPSADNTNCTAANVGKWFDGSQCFNGLVTPITFDLSGSSLSLPDKTIVSVAYNTSHYGYSPLGEEPSCYSSSGGCGYDSLNVALASPPSVGTDPLPDSAYLNSLWSGAYCSGTTGSFRLDSGCWTGYQPVFKVEALDTTPPATPPSQSCGNFRTGTFSRNYCIIKNKTNANVTLNNTSTVKQNIRTRSNTGNNTTSNNTAGDGIKSGNSIINNNVSSSTNYNKIIINQ